MFCKIFLMIQKLQQIRKLAYKHILGISTEGPRWNAAGCHVKTGLGDAAAPHQAIWWEGEFEVEIQGEKAG